jgi:hypothetical protein
VSSRKQNRQSRVERLNKRDESGTYRLRVFNDGRFLETQIKLLEEDKGMTWGFALSVLP